MDHEARSREVLLGEPASGIGARTDEGDALERSQAAGDGRGIGDRAGEDRRAVAQSTSARVPFVVKRTAPRP
jgi:hypothetical protein